MGLRRLSTCEETCQDDRDRIWATISGVRGAVEVLTGRVEALTQRLGESEKASPEAEKALESYAAQRTREAEEDTEEPGPDDWMLH